MSIAETGAKVFGHGVDAVKAATPHLKEGAQAAYNSVSGTLNKVSTHIQTHGWQKSAGHAFEGAKAFAGRRPLVTGAVALTGAYVAGTAVFGGHQRRVMQERQREQQFYNGR